MTFLTNTELSITKVSSKSFFQNRNTYPAASCKNRSFHLRDSTVDYRPRRFMRDIGRMRGTEGDRCGNEKRYKRHGYNPTSGASWLEKPV